MAELSPSHPDFEECEGYCAAPALGNDDRIPTAQAEVRVEQVRQAVGDAPHEFHSLPLYAT